MQENCFVKVQNRSVICFRQTAAVCPELDRMRDICACRCWALAGQYDLICLLLKVNTVTPRNVSTSLFTLLLVSSLAYAQDVHQPDAPAISISGRSRITGGSTDPLPGSSALPNQYARWEFEPSLAFYGVPISAHVLLTTENDPSRRAMNSAEIIFDVKAFQSMLRERVMAEAKAAQAELTARAAELRTKLTDPSVVADLARFRELEGLSPARDWRISTTPRVF
jgi:hypothetical protein